MTVINKHTALNIKILYDLRLQNGIPISDKGLKTLGCALQTLSDLPPQQECNPESTSRSYIYNKMSALPCDTTPEHTTTLDILYKLFNFKHFPSKNSLDRELYLTIRRILTKLHDFDAIDTYKLEQQYKRYPLMKWALNKVRDQYHQFQALSSENDVDKICDILERQHQNLKHLYMLLKFFSKKEEHSRALSTITINHELQYLLEPFINGQQEFDIKTIEQLHITLEKEIYNLHISYPPGFSPTIINKNRRSTSPISCSSIHQQAELHKACSLGKIWTFQQKKITPQGSSNNSVFALKNPNSSAKTVAYLKEGSSKEPGAAVMETLVWEIAVLAGLERFFVATKLINLGGGRRGSVQKTQPGHLLDCYFRRRNNKLPPLKMQAVLEGTLVSLFFGFFDAHTNNIFINPEGKVIYFDNTCALPHTNGILKRGAKFFPSYRCSLLSLEHSRKTLSRQEWQKIRCMAEQFKEKLPIIKAYLLGEKVTKRTQSHLPPEWLNPTKSLEAMQQRIDTIIEACKNWRIKNLQDLALHVIPDYKLNLLITVAADNLPFLRSRTTKPTLNTRIIMAVSFAFSQTGKKDLIFLLNSCSQQGIDITRFLTPASDPNSPLTSLIHNLLTSTQSNSSTSSSQTSTSSAETNVKNNNALFSSLMQKAVPDYKEVSRR